MDDLDPFSLSARVPTVSRPLLGLTVLVVEDSKFASEALRLMCLRSGARIRRADSLNSARRHLKVYRPSVALIDIGLRDGSGAELIRELVTVNPRPEVVLGMSGDPDGEFTSLDAGAEGFLAKPIVSLPVFQTEILRHLPADRQPPAPRSLPDELIEPDLLAYQDDLEHIADVLHTDDGNQSVDYVAQFLSGVAKSAKDAAMLEAVLAIRTAQAKGRELGPDVARLAGLVQARLDHKMAM